MPPRRPNVFLLSAAALLWLCAGAVNAADVRAMQAWSRATPPGVTVGVGYVMLHNEGKQPRLLVGASSPAAATVEMHETTLGNNGLSQMRPVKKLTVPPGGEVTFEPNGRHLMLVGLKAPLVAGQRVPVTLTFDKGEPVSFELEVLALTATGPAAAEHHHH